MAEAHHEAVTHDHNGVALKTQVRWADLPEPFRAQELERMAAAITAHYDALLSELPEEAVEAVEPWAKASLVDPSKQRKGQEQIVRTVFLSLRSSSRGANGAGRG